jgi:hypothetical protein
MNATENFDPDRDEPTVPPGLDGLLDPDTQHGGEQLDSEMQKEVLA